jgi:protease I
MEASMKIIFLFVMLLCLFCGGGGKDQSMNEESEIPQMAQSVLMIIAPKNFRDEEFKEPYDLFTSTGIEVTVASTDTHPAQGMLGMVVKPDITLERVNPHEYDALIIVGGSGCTDLWDDTTLHTIVQTFNRSKKTIAAICLAPVVLGKAGILKDITATVYPTAKDELGACGAHYIDSDVEVDGNIITCSGPQAAKDFATAILRAVSQ